MATSVYSINKGINKPIEFRGLKAQYIGYGAACIVVLLIGFAILYILGLNPYACLSLVLLTGTGILLKIYQWSNRYGEHGWMKKLARRHVPHTLKCHSRKIFKTKSHGKVF